MTTEAALGEERVRAALSLLTASRRGLDDTEILDLLAHDELFRSEETYCESLLFFFYNLVENFVYFIL